MAIPNLETAAVGRPINRLGISLFPVYLPVNTLPGIATGPSSGITINELPAASVPHLMVTNPTDRPILLVEGEPLVGGQQNRTLNVSVLVPAGATLKIPVTCLEAGRWGQRRDFERGATFTPRRVRRAKQEAVARSMAMAGSRQGDQGAVWGAIATELEDFDVRPATGAIAAADERFQRDHYRAAAVDELAQLGPLPGQCGVVVAHGPRVVAAEVFGAADLLLPHWAALVRSHLLEHPTAQGRTSATIALRLLNRFGTTESNDSAGIGLGIERHVRNDRITGQALTLDDATVHASVFNRH